MKKIKENGKRKYPLNHKDGCKCFACGGENLGKLFKKGHKTWNKGIRYEQIEGDKNPSKRLEVREKISQSLIKRWKNKEYKERVVRKILKKLAIRPTSYEKKIISIVENNKLPYQYVGDGKFILDGMNPDFINTNGKKIAIEVYEEFFKKKNYGSGLNYERIRRNRFKKFGWKVIFISQDIINNEKEILKIIPTEDTL